MATTGALGLHAYLTSGEHSDITIKFSGREFKAHKIILTAKSGWFRGAFRSGLAEASAETIELHGDDPDALELSIRFLYEEPYPRWTSDDEEEAHLNAMLRHITIYELANKYDIPTLSLAAAQALSSCFDKFSNVVENIAVARALYCSISHDGYGLKERFVKSLTADFRVLKPELQEFAKENLEFAGHLLSDMWARQSEFLDQVVVECSHCNYRVFSAILGNTGTTGKLKDWSTMEWMMFTCPECDRIMSEVI